MTDRDPLLQFRSALAGRGITAPADLLADGHLHRCDVEGHPGKGDAAYVLHLDDVPAGGYQNWTDGLGWETWRADLGRQLTRAEERAYRQKIDDVSRERAAAIAMGQEQARVRAQEIWAHAPPCAEHPYLTRKKVMAYGTRLHGSCVVLPVRDADGLLHSLQFIDGGGKKRFLEGGRKRGCYFMIGDIPEPGLICVAEGFATAASIHEATGYPVTVAFDAGNLEPVAVALRSRYPSATLLVCADDDEATPGNPGRTKAIAAAQAVGGIVVTPPFDTERPLGATDFNDLHRAYGLGAVHRCIAQALRRASADERPQAQPARGVYAGQESDTSTTGPSVTASDEDADPQQPTTNNAPLAGDDDAAPVPSDRVVAPPHQPMAVARALVAELYQHPEGPVLRYHRGDFYLWDGQCYPAIDQRDVRSAAYRFLEHATYFDPQKGELPFAPSRRKIDDVLDALKAITLLDTSREAPTWTRRGGLPVAAEMVVMANGLLHVPTRTLHPHSPTFFAHHALPFPYLRETPPAKKWLEFLAELWADDVSSISALQEVMGYILGGDTRLQKIFLLVGPKRGGKGTIARVLTGLLGRHNVAAPTLAGLSTNFGLAPLIGKPLALISDARLSSKADNQIVVERLLSISGEDCLTIDRKYREPWTGRLPSRFLVLSNELPRLTDASGALASRFVVFVLTRSFYGKENPGLTDDLLAEAPAIFNWALEGLDRLSARGNFVPPASGADAVQQLEDLSSPLSAFVRDVCVVGRFHVGADDLWDAWKRWCEQENRHPGTKSVFGRDLKAALPTVRRGRPRGSEDERVYRYEGIGLRSEHGSALDLGPLGPDGAVGRSGPSSPSTSPLQLRDETRFDTDELQVIHDLLEEQL